MSGSLEDILIWIEGFKPLWTAALVPNDLIEGTRAYDPARPDKQRVKFPDPRIPYDFA